MEGPAAVGGHQFAVAAEFGRIVVGAVQRQQNTLAVGAQARHAVGEAGASAATGQFSMPNAMQRGGDFEGGDCASGRSWFGGRGGGGEAILA